MAGDRLPGLFASRKTRGFSLGFSPRAYMDASQFGK